MKKRKILMAVGGSNLGFPGKKWTSKPIDKRVIQLSGKKRPRALFIPTATMDDREYTDLFMKRYSSLGCKVDTLLLYKERPSKKIMSEKIQTADIIYVGGGNTLRMMQLWRKLDVDKMIRRAYNRGAVVTGVSAGCICWFRQGNSDSRLYSSNSKALIKVTGLGLYDTMVCPHYDSEKRRQPALKQMMKTTKGVALAFEDNAALEIIDGQYKLLRSLPKKNIYRIYWKRGKFYKQPVEKRNDYRPLTEITTK